MFTVYHSNQLDLLKALTTALIEREPLDNPFQQEVVLVQSPAWPNGYKCNWLNSSVLLPI